MHPFITQLYNRVIQALLVTILFIASASGNEELKLPNLGESSNSLFSPEQEYKLGRAWLRAFRSQAPTLDDPLIHDYLENLVYELVTHSELQDRRIELVIVDNPVLNAFAVPGGVIGIHSGLMLYAQTEDELSTVLAHEIAHLSQRHFSRSIEQQKKQAPLSMAGLLAGLVLVATTGGAAGIAAIQASQAAALESQLRYSRSNEAEADRVGMQTLVKADKNPHAAPAMFERMLQSSRYSSGDRIPEFLRTHPLSESRIADTRNRARQYPKTVREKNLQFQLMRTRVQLHHANSPQRAVSEFRGMLEGRNRSPEATRYGLALALTRSAQPAAARAELDFLMENNPQQLEYIIASAELDMSIGEAQSAISTLTREVRLYPGNHGLTMAYATALMQNNQPHIAEEVLLDQSRLRPNDPGMWYLLAEIQGLSGNIIGLHQSRAEYFILNGILDEAERQLSYALALTRNDYHTSAKINQRIADVAELRERMEL